VTEKNGIQNDFEVLEKIRPRFVIMYDPELGFVRRLEVFKAMNPSFPIKVYFLVYDNSIEERKYLQGIRREKEAFEKLILEKSVIRFKIYLMIIEYGDSIGSRRTI
jgi:DNA excision repair protein ERCC-4